MSKRRDETRPVVQEVTHILRQRIIHGQYPPGSVLPSERRLADELRVSRMSVSRALEQLARENVVDQHVGVGSRVRPDAAQRLPPGTIAMLRGISIKPPAPESALIMQGIVDTLSREQFPYEELFIAPGDYTGPVEKRVFGEDILNLRARYGGFLFIEGIAPDAITALQHAGAPVVVANLETDLEVSATWVDHRRIARTAVEVLAALGHRRIGLVATTPHRAFYRKTLQGYREALEHLNLLRDERLISLCPASSPLDAYTAARELLRSEPAPTAIVAGRDLHAEGICRAAAEQDLTLGHDLSVIGFDDVSWTRAPAILTTFQEPCHELGATAARMLIERMRQGRIDIEKREISAPLILRRSAGPPPKNLSDGMETAVSLTAHA